MSDLKVPVLTFITGEGGSGGALALAVANKVYMLENAMYSVLSPEGFATILWKDGSRRDEAADLMKIKAEDQLEMGIVEGVVQEENLMENLKTIIEKISTAWYNFQKKNFKKAATNVLENINFIQARDNCLFL